MIVLDQDAADPGAGTELGPVFGGVVGDRLRHRAGTAAHKRPEKHQNA